MARCTYCKILKLNTFQIDTFGTEVTTRPYCWQFFHHLAHPVAHSEHNHDSRQERNPADRDDRHGQAEQVGKDAGRGVVQSRVALIGFRGGAGFVTQPGQR